MPDKIFLGKIVRFIQQEKTFLMKASKIKNRDFFSQNFLIAKRTCKPPCAITHANITLQFTLAKKMATSAFNKNPLC